MLSCSRRWIDRAASYLAPVLRIARREPSAILLAAQLLAVLLYPFMEDSDAGRAVFSVVGIGVLGLVLLAVRSYVVPALQLSDSVQDIVHRSPPASSHRWSMLSHRVIGQAIGQGVDRRRVARGWRRWAFSGRPRAASEAL